MLPSLYMRIDVLQTRLRRSFHNRRNASGLPYANPYASHTPILIAAAVWLRPKRILELGCGMYSTGLFLDRRAFPELTTLVSYEDNRDWYSRIHAQFGGDPRLELRFRPKAPMGIGTLPNDGDKTFDLVFVDNSDCATARAATITSVLSHLDPHTVVLIHDAEVYEYQAAIRGSLNVHAYIFNIFRPYTAVCWHERAPAHAPWKTMRSMMLATRHLQAESDIASIREWYEMHRLGEAP